tara:strand:- start:17 stop:250 length:234 start_codon:yes stop_codon:yes gene_type:complete
MKRDRQESAIQRLEKTVALHESNTELVNRIIEDHAESTSEKYLKFNRNLSKDQIDKMRKQKIERLNKTIENTKRNLR